MCSLSLITFLPIVCYALSHFRHLKNGMVYLDKCESPIKVCCFVLQNAFELDPATGEITTALDLNRNLVAQVFFVILANDTNAEMPDTQIGMSK